MQSVSVAPVYGPAPSSGSAVTLGEGSQVLSELWSARMFALQSYNWHSIETLETGFQLQSDQYGYFDSPCIGSPVIAPTSMAEVIPMQSSWPVFAVGFITDKTCPGNSTGPTCTFIMIAVQLKQGAPWKIAFITAYAGAAPPPSPPSPTPPVPPQIVSAFENSYFPEYANFLQVGFQNCAAPPAPEFSPGVFTSNQMFQGCNPPGGVSHKRTYQAVRRPFFTFTVSNGVYVGCGAISFRDVGTPTSPLFPLFQPANLSTWGPPIAPGSYSSITLNGYHLDCMVATTSSRPTVFADQVVRIAITGVRERP